MYNIQQLTNMLRSEVEHIPQTGLPLDAFPEKVREIVLDLSRYENFNVEYTASIILSAVATAIGNYQRRMEDRTCPLYDAGRSSRVGQDSSIGFYLQAYQ